jgi:hypothetical protein
MKFENNESMVKKLMKKSGEKEYDEKEMKIKIIKIRKVLLLG